MYKLFFCILICYVISVSAGIANENIEHILFDRNSHDVDSEERKKIKKLKELIGQNQHYEIRLEGYASSDGNRLKRKNFELAKRRVETIKNILEEEGIKSSVEKAMVGATNDFPVLDQRVDIILSTYPYLSSSGYSVSPDINHLASSGYSDVLDRSYSASSDYSVSPDSNHSENTYVWNIWAEEIDESDEPPETMFTPIPFLASDTSYGVNLHLSGIPYQSLGIRVIEANNKLKDKLKKLIKDKKENPTLKLVLITNPLVFETPSHSLTEKIEINLNKIRDFAKKQDVPSPENALSALQENDSSFVFGKTMIKLKTKKNIPEYITNTSIGLSVWYDGRPIDELSIPFCVKEACNINTTSLGGHSVFDVVVSDNSVSKPDAALHFIELDNKVYGVFSKKDNASSLQEDRYQIWKVSDDYENFIKELKKNQEDFGKTKWSAQDEAESLKVWKEQYRPIASVMRTFLFPNYKKDCIDSKLQNESKACTSFKAFTQEVINSPKNEKGDNDPKTIFIRMLTDLENHPIYYPFGLLNFGDDISSYLGFYFRIETPLPRQNYQPTESCISTLIPVLPPTNTKDGVLQEVLKPIVKRIGGGMGGNQYDFRFGNQYPTVFTKMSTNFYDWIQEQEEGDETPVLLIITSHHDEGKLYFVSDFNQDDGIRNENFIRSFKKPSVALLNGCSTGDNVSTGFMKELNSRGFDAGIITNSTISGELAGQFMECFIEQIEKAEGDSISVGKAFWQTQKCLNERSDVYRNDPHILSYTLAGNSTIKLCKPSN